MKTYIVLLRGVTPTGKNKVPMAQLREVLTDAGFANVRTYIQSGNAFVDTDFSPAKIEADIHDLIKDHIGADLAIVVRTDSELQAVLDSNPFTQGYDPSRLFFAMFAQAPAADKVKALVAQDFGDEKLHINKTSAVMYIPGIYGRGKLSGGFLEKKLDTPTTMRNLNTMKKLIELARAK